MNAINQLIEIGGAVFFLLFGLWATAYAYGFVGEKLAGSFCWKPEFKHALRWLGPLLVLLCCASLVFLFTQR
ncbi:MAG TPA: hypothetical protein DIT13_19245 [Verrucomicrobiales bacterium]|nr:hypothetical protein [Verrucomicrobiales bacterium]HRJ08472.1 hypothetical protein [Prosthecobacter sp.]HRK15834.1 hypothetical protein [Prosthecobacter sp.]